MARKEEIMNKDILERLIKVLGIIVLVSLGLRIVIGILGVVFGITFAILLPLLLVILVLGLPILAIYGLYKLVTGRNNSVW